MATLSIAFVLVSDFKGTAVTNPADSITEAITTSGTSQQSTESANSTKQVVRLTVSGGAVWVAIGTNPTADAGDQFLLVDGQTDFFAVNNGDKVAVIDAA